MVRGSSENDGSLEVNISKFTGIWGIVVQCLHMHFGLKNGDAKAAEVTATATLDYLCMSDLFLITFLKNNYHTMIGNQV